MVALKAVIFALLVVVFQASALTGNFEKLYNKAEGAIDKAVSKGAITAGQGKAVLDQVKSAALDGKTSILTDVDIALNRAVDHHVITTSEKVKILVAAIKANGYKEKNLTVTQGVRKAVDAAVAAGVLEKRKAEKVKEVAPRSVTLDVSATTSAADVEKAL